MSRPLKKDSALCAKAGLAGYSFPIDVKTHNITAQRQVYDLVAAATQETPALKISTILFEGYSLQGAKAVPSDSTACAYRDDNLLLAQIMMYVPDGPELDKKASILGEEVRQILYRGSGQTELHTYVDYAFEETRENMYSYESWRQERLLALKNKYDPHRRFSFYALIE
ncbi:hypothetical protein ACJ41O_009736 [Fusarium nematophilum]